MEAQAWTYVLQQGPLVVILVVNLYAFLRDLVTARLELRDQDADGRILTETVVDRTDVIGGFKVTVGTTPSYDVTLGKDEDAGDDFAAELARVMSGPVQAARRWERR